jgi:hypothetical protein
MLYAAETDCTHQGKYIELKTSRLLDPTRRARELVLFHRKKSLKWWLQCTFTDIDTVIVGYYDGHGVMQKIGATSVGDMPEDAQMAMQVGAL